MRPVDGSASINRRDILDNKQIDRGKMYVPDPMGKAAHCLCLDGFSLDENVLGFREARAASEASTNRINFDKASSFSDRTQRSA